MQVVQHGRLAETHQAAGKHELLELIRFGADSLVKVDEAASVLDVDLDALLAQGETQTQELSKRVEAMASGSLSDSLRFDGGCGYGGGGAGGEGASQAGVDEEKEKEGMRDLAADFVLELGKRARNVVSYNEEVVYRERNKRLREVEEEERASRRESKQADKDSGWTPKMKRSMADVDGADIRDIRGGKPGSADFLLRSLIEEAQQRCRAGGGRACRGLV